MSFFAAKRHRTNRIVPDVSVLGQLRRDLQRCSFFVGAVETRKGKMIRGMVRGKVLPRRATTGPSDLRIRLGYMIRASEVGGRSKEIGSGARGFLPVGERIVSDGNGA